MVRSELIQFSPELGERPHVVAVNKLDLEAARRLQRRTRRKNVVFVSAVTGEGLAELRSSIVKTLAVAPERRLAAAGKTTRLPVRLERDLVVEKTSGGFVVHGDRVESLVEQTDLDSEAALARFQSWLDRLGVNNALEAAGAQPGDSVRIADEEFEYQP